MSDNDSEKGDHDEETRRATAAAAAKAAEAARDTLEVEIIEPSPTGFNPNKMPKTVLSHVFICAKQSALSDRVRVMTSLEECDDKVKELEELEAERDKDDSEDELSIEVRDDISRNLQKVKGFMASHTDNTHNIAQMCNYILTIMKDSPTDDSKRKDVQD